MSNRYKNKCQTQNQISQHEYQEKICQSLKQQHDFLRESMKNKIIQVLNKLVFSKIHQPKQQDGFLINFINSVNPFNQEEKKLKQLLSNQNLAKQLSLFLKIFNKFYKENQHNLKFQQSTGKQEEIKSLEQSITENNIIIQEIILKNEKNSKQLLEKEQNIRFLQQEKANSISFDQINKRLNNLNPSGAIMLSNNQYLHFITQNTVRYFLNLQEKVKNLTTNNNELLNQLKITKHNQSQLNKQISFNQNLPIKNSEINFAEQKLKQSNENLQKRQKQISQLKLQIILKNNQLNYLSTKLNNQAQIIKKKQSQIAQLNTKVNLEKCQLQKMKKSLQQQKNRNDYKIESQKLINQQKILQQKCIQQNNTLKSKINQFERNITFNENNLSHQKQRKSEIINLSTKIQQLTRNHKKIIHDLNNKHNQQFEKFKQNQIEINNLLNEQIIKLKGVMSQYQKVNQLQNQNIIAKQTKINMLQQQIQEITKQKNKFYRLCNEKDQIVNHSLEQFTAIQSNLKQKEQKIDLLKSDNDYFKKIINDKEQFITKLKEVIQTFSQENAGLKQRLRSLQIQNQIKPLQARLQKQITKINGQKQNLFQLKNKLQKQIQQLKAQILQHKIKQKQLEQAFNNQQTQIKKLKQQIQQKINENNKNTSLLSEKDKNINILSQQLPKTKYQLQQKNQQIYNLKTENSDLKTKINEKQQYISHLQEKLQKYKQSQISTKNNINQKQAFDQELSIVQQHAQKIKIQEQNFIISNLTSISTQVASIIDLFGLQKQFNQIKIKNKKQSTIKLIIDQIQQNIPKITQIIHSKNLIINDLIIKVQKSTKQINTLSKQTLILNQNQQICQQQNSQLSYQLRNSQNQIKNLQNVQKSLKQLLQQKSNLIQEHNERIQSLTQEKGNLQKQNQSLSQKTQLFNAKMQIKEFDFNQSKNQDNKTHFFFNGQILKFKPNKIQFLYNVISKISSINSTKMIFRKNMESSNLALKIKKILTSSDSLSNAILILFRSKAQRTFAIFCHKEKENKFTTILINVDTEKHFGPAKETSKNGFTEYNGGMNVVFGADEVKLKNSSPGELIVDFDVNGEKYFEIEDGSLFTGQKSQKVLLQEVELHEIQLII